MILLRSDSDPERSAIISDLLGRLSAEAKFVMYVLFNTPGELSELLFDGIKNEATKHLHWMVGNRMNKERIKHYLKLLEWDTPTINRTLTSIKTFTRELEKLN